MESAVSAGVVTVDDVLLGIRALASDADSETVRLRSWELLGKHLGMFRDSASEGGAPVVRRTPPLNAAQVGDDS